MQAEQGGKTDWEALPVALVEESPEAERHARFHRQFVTLVRRHAQILVDDTRIHNLFHRHCFVAKEQCAASCLVPPWLAWAFSLGSECVCSCCRPLLRMPADPQGTWEKIGAARKPVLEYKATCGGWGCRRVAQVQQPTPLHAMHAGTSMCA